MKNQQLEFNYLPGPTHRYAVLDAPSDSVDPLEANLHVRKPPTWPNAPIKPHTPLISVGSGETSYGSGNPYANIDSDDDVYPSSLSLPRTAAVTKREFRKRAARILRQYSPATGKSRPLRPEFNRFIEQNVSKDAHQRFDVLTRLAKYDLEASGYAGTIFNRELSDRLVKSLDKISKGD